MGFCFDLKLNRMYYIILKFILLANKIQIKKIFSFTRQGQPLLIFMNLFI